MHGVLGTDNRFAGCVGVVLYDARRKESVTVKIAVPFIWRPSLNKNPKIMDGHTA